MKKEHIVSYSLDQIMTMKGRTDPNAPVGPSLPKDFWDHAVVVQPGETKQQITLRLDSDVLAWFRAQGKGYQTMMNNVLRSYVDAQK